MKVVSVIGGQDLGAAPELKRLRIYAIKSQVVMAAAVRQYPQLSPGGFTSYPRRNMARALETVSTALTSVQSSGVGSASRG